jgi:hypothetical protein
MSSLQQAGATVWIEVQVGSEQRPVQDLFGVSFSLAYDTSRVTVQDDAAGEFLGNDVVYSSNVDAETGEVGIGVSRKSGDGGVEGSGTVARVQVQISSDAVEGDTLGFELTDVSANDPSGNPISLDPKSGGLTVGTAIPMQPAIEVLSGEADRFPAPGDTIAVDVAVGTDQVPVSDLFGTSFTLGYDSSGLTILSDTTGPFLGTDLVYSANVDSTDGTIGVGVSRKAGAEGVDGAGSVARVTARVDPTIAQGETLSFNVAEAQARNSADSSIAVTASDTIITVNAIPDPPSDLTATQQGAAVELSWTASSAADAERYRIYRDSSSIDSTAGPGGLVPLDSVSAGTRTFIDSTGQLGTTYSYRLTTVDALGGESGFSNGAQATPRIAPVAETDSVGSVTDSTATLYGTVAPGGDTTDVRFRYHPSGEQAAADTLEAVESPVGGRQEKGVSVSATELQAGVLYTYQVLASNSVGSDTGQERSFRAGATPPGGRTGPAASVADSSATLKAKVFSGGDSTTVRFEYGLDSEYGQSVAADTVAGPDSVTVSASVSGLLPGTEYHYRVTVSNSIGGGSGADSTFVTQAVPPVAQTDSVSDITDTAAVVYGSVNPGGGATEVAFRYYPDGSPSGADTVTVGNGPLTGTQDTVVSASLQNLSSGQRYVFQVLATNSAGGAAGTEQSFRTGFFPPAVRRDTAIVRRGGTRMVQVLANDTSNRNLDSASVSITTAPRHGSASVNAASGAITYVHDGSDNLTDSLAYTVADVQGQRSEPATVVIQGIDVRVEEGAAARGASVPIEVVIEGGIRPSEARLYVRRGGRDQYQSLSLTQSETAPLRLTASVPDTLVTTQGIDYYAVLSTGAHALTLPPGGQEAARQRPRHLPVSFAEWAAPFELAPEAYRMVSIPAEPANGIRAALEATYGPYDQTEWRLVRWDPNAGPSANGAYVEFPELDSLRPGDGMWLITSGGEAVTLPEGRTVDASSPRGIVLRPGWNQIGSPFGFSVPWEAVLAASGLSASEVDGPVAYRDSGGAGGGYRYGQDRLEPWEAYFVRNRTSETDTLWVPGGAQSAASPEARSPQGRPEALAGGHVDASNMGESTRAGSVETGENAHAAGPGYTVEVEARTAGGEEQRVWLGLRTEARAGPDALDFAQAPPIGRSVRLSVMGEESRKRPTRWAGSFKPVEGEGRSWSLAVMNRSGEEKQRVRVRLNSQGTPPEGHQRYLLDLERGRRMAEGRELVLEPGETRRLKVMVGTEAYADQHSEGISVEAFANELRENYPNPFGQQTRIEYVLSSEQEVTVEVYNVLGQRVRTLVDGREKAGLHAITWRGENRYGTPVGSGVYFYRIEAEDFTETRKMVMVR